MNITRIYTNRRLPHQLVDCAGCQESDVSSLGYVEIQAQFFFLGQMDGTNKRFYCRNQIDSVTDVTDNSGAILGQQSFDPFGQPTQLQGSYVPDFGFGGYYLHSRSGLNLTVTRKYSPALGGRWINRDPIEENGGINLFSYVNNNPISFDDPLGIQSNPPPTLTPGPAPSPSPVQPTSRPGPGPGLNPIVRGIIIGEIINNAELLAQLSRIRKLQNELNDCYDEAIAQYKKNLADAGDDPEKKKAALCRFNKHVADKCDPISAALGRERSNLIKPIFGIPPGGPVY